MSPVGFCLCKQENERQKTMNMVDTKKSFRGVLLWREDIIKVAKVLKRPLSEHVRDLLHKDMEKYSLSSEGEDVLRAQISAALDARKCRGKGKYTKSNKHLTVDFVDIPELVRKNPKFVRKVDFGG